MASVRGAVRFAANQVRVDLRLSVFFRDIADQNKQFDLFDERDGRFGLSTSNLSPFSSWFMPCTRPCSGKMSTVRAPRRVVPFSALHLLETICRQYGDCTAAKIFLHSL